LSTRTESADDAPDGVRVDKWLWAARFYKTRSAAAEAVDLGRVKVNDAKVKPAKTLREGDTIALRIGLIDREVRVCVLSDVRRAAPIAQTLYAETEASVAARESAESRRRLQKEPAHSRKGRPTKRERRDLAEFVDSGRDPDGF
jgi:ribosome-associated heat shock protein Hsp15